MLQSLLSFILALTSFTGAILHGGHKELEALPHAEPVRQHHAVQ